MKNTFSDEDYRRSLLNELAGILPEGCSAEFVEIAKNNRTAYTGIRIQKQDSSVMPVIRLDMPREVRELAADIADKYADIKESSDLYDNISISRDGILQNIFCRLVNYELNRDELGAVPCFRLADLAVTLHYLVECTEDGVKSFRLNRSYLAGLDIDEGELLSHAIENTRRLFPPILVSIEKMLFSSMFGQRDSESWTTENVLAAEYVEPASKNEPELYIATNKHVINGAACILDKDFMERARDFLGTDFYILPSSIHEVLFLRYDCGNHRDSLSEMVGEINRAQVPEEEVLSDGTYLYSELKEQLSELIAAAAS